MYQVTAKKSEELYSWTQTPEAITLKVNVK